MSSKVEPVEQPLVVKRYEIEYPVTAYTFPTEALIHRVRIDEIYLHIELTDGRILSIPTWWIPPVHNASLEARQKFEISRSRTMIIWDPDISGINDELRIDDYLVSHPRS